MTANGTRTTAAEICAVPVNYVDPAGTNRATAESGSPGGMAMECNFPREGVPLVCLWYPVSAGGGVSGSGPTAGGSIQNPQELGYGWALTVQNLVNKGAYTDCEGLAAYAASMATFYGDSPSKFMESFGVLVPYVPGEQLLGINWNDNAVTLGVTGKSGFATPFQDGYGTAAGPNGDDQAHHFAAFFQAGFFNLTNATAAAYAWEGQNGFKNQGDINLGLAAAALGGLVRAGAVKPADVADTIRKGLCAH